MLLDIGNAFQTEKNSKVAQSILSALALSTRDTDVAGWYKQDKVVGIMFTEIAPDLKKSILATILMRVSGSLKDCLTLEQFSQIGITFHLFPEDWEEHSHAAGSERICDVSGLAAGSSFGNAGPGR
jgi:hypothetical protein